MEPIRAAWKSVWARGTSRYPRPPVIPERLQPLLDETADLAGLFAAAGHHLYLVGGVVRDLVLNRAHLDLDFTTDAHPEKIHHFVQKTDPRQQREEACIEALKVGGVVHKPAILANVAPSLYLPLETLQEFVMPGQPPQVTRIMIDLKDNADAQAFGERWRGKLGAQDPLLKLRLSSENKSLLAHNLQAIHMLSYLGRTWGMGERHDRRTEEIAAHGLARRTSTAGWTSLRPASNGRSAPRP